MGRDTVVLESQISHVDDGHATAIELFRSIDRDNDGSITQDEFTKAFGALQRVVKQNHQDLAQSKRRARALWSVLCFSMFLLFCTFAGNLGLVYMLLEVTKEMRLNTAPSGVASDVVASEAGSVLTNNNGESLSTANTLQIFNDASDLPLLGPNFNYASISYLRLPHVRPGPSGMNETVMVGYAVEGYRWYSLTDLDLVLSMDTTLHITKDALELSRTSEAADDFLFESIGTEASGRQLASRRTMLVGSSVAGGVAVQEVTSSTSGSRVCPATAADIKANRNCFDMWKDKCIKCRGDGNKDKYLVGGSTNIGNAGATSSGSMPSSSSSTSGSRACPATVADFNNNRNCYDTWKRKCVKCTNSDNEDDYLVGGGSKASRVCPANNADAAANRNCYDVWKKKCVKCSGSFKGVTGDDTD